MKVEEYEFKCVERVDLKLIDTPYIPRYYMMIYPDLAAYSSCAAIKVRSDIVIPKLLIPTLRSIIPEKELTPGVKSSVYIFAVQPDGRIDNYPIGVLEAGETYLKFHLMNIYHEWGMYYFNSAQSSLELWLDQNHPKYTLVDYEEEELFLALREGLSEYNTRWKGKEGRKAEKKIRESSGKGGKKA